MKPVTWGILSTAAIGTERVIPAMQQADTCNIQAIASRDLQRAQQVASEQGIAQAYGSYEALLADPTIEAIYIPLPNDMHVDWSSRCLKAGKHVLCEKPIALNADEARTLLTIRDRTGLLIEEAFMVRHHPQWARVREIIDSGEIGDLVAVQCAYSHFLDDPNNIRNDPDKGGGAMYDIGSYAITISRLVFDAEPVRVMALLERDSRYGTDCMSSALLQFAQGHACFTVSIQATRQQHAQIIGTKGWIRADFPFAHPVPTACKLYIGDSSCMGAMHSRVEELPAVNQYTLQGERFSRRIRGEVAPNWPLETAIANMQVIDALFESAASGQWQSIPASGEQP